MRLTAILISFLVAPVANADWCAVSSFGNELECFKDQQLCEKAAQFLEGYCRQTGYMKPAGKIESEYMGVSDYQKLRAYDAQKLKEASTWDNVIHKGPTVDEIIDEFCKNGCYDENGKYYKGSR